MSEEITAESAFNQAAIGYSFLGETLLPWSGSREICAQAMGMKAPVLNDEEKALLEDGRLYPGAVKDVIVCLWVCSTKNASELSVEEVKAKAWTIQRARNNPIEAYEEAEKWAIERKLQKTNGEVFKEGYYVMIAMLTGKAVSEFEVKAEGETGGASEGKV